MLQPSLVAVGNVVPAALPKLTHSDRNPARRHARQHIDDLAVRLPWDLLKCLQDAHLPSGLMTWKDTRPAGVPAPPVEHRSKQAVMPIHISHPHLLTNHIQGSSQCQGVLRCLTDRQKKRIATRCRAC